MTAQPRFIVLAQNGAYIVHDREDGDDSTEMTRYSSAAHLAAQWNRQWAQEQSMQSLARQVLSAADLNAAERAE